MDPIKLLSLRQFTQEWTAEKFGHGKFDPTRQPQLIITPAEDVGCITAAVSPDCSYRLVQAALAAAQREVCLYIYNLSAEHLLDLLREARDRGVQIQLMYDISDTRGHEKEKLAGLGVELKEAPSSGGRKVFTVCHQKFFVIDESILVLGSANWAGTSIPKIIVPGTFKKGNREWLVRIDHPGLAAWFKGLFQADWDIPALEAPSGLGIEIGLEEEIVPPAPTYLPALLAKMPDEVFDLGEIELEQPARVTPILSPDNYYDLARTLILEAESSIDIEQQYILAGGPKTEGLLAALEQHKDEVEIRVIVSPAYRKEGAKDNWELSADSLDAYGLKDRLRAMNLTYYTHLHNKGVIIDRRKVIVSSTNWSENSLARAREAGVLIEAPEIAEYYAQVFDFDWSIAWEAADVPANLANLFQEAMFIPGGFEEVHPADLV
ncbi:MAG: hypothetical protein JXB15_02155 [Anaerolineales bacterium]|nr:hypothetical protein [Anaerolineales bacterium]